jgi:hypothetical protein
MLFDWLRACCSRSSSQSSSSASSPRARDVVMSDLLKACGALALLLGGHDPLGEHRQRAAHVCLGVPSRYGIPVSEGPQDQQDSIAPPVLMSWKHRSRPTAPASCAATLKRKQAWSLPRCGALM